MSRELFRDVVSPEVRVQSTSRYTILLSVAAHALIVAAVIIVPLMATGVMPDLPGDEISFISAAPTPPPPPSPPPPATSSTPPVNRDAAPRDMPPEIGPELPPTPPSNTSEHGIPSLGPTTTPDNGVGLDIGRDVTPPPPPPPPAPQKPIRPGGDIREPVKVKHVAPVYPQIAIAARISGRVVIDAVIGTDGVVREARVLSGTPMLNQAALDAVKQWRYTPTMLNNVPVQVIMTVTVRFNLQ